MWIVSGVVGLLVILYVGFGLMYTGALGCPAFLDCGDWGQVSRGDSYAEDGLYERAIQEYDEAIRLERNHLEAYYKRGLAYEALGKTKEAERDFERAIQKYDEGIREYPDDGRYQYYRALAYEALGKTIEAERDFERAIQKYDEAIREYPDDWRDQFLRHLWGDPLDAEVLHYRALAYEALGKTIEAERDFAKAKELGYYSAPGLLFLEGLNRRLTVHEGGCPVTILDDFTKAIEVTPLILEGEMSRDVECQAWSFNGDEGQILRFEPRPKSGSHIDFGHVELRLSLVGDERLQTAVPEVIGKDEELREITLSETGTYTLQVEGNIDESSGAYVITISEQQP